MFEAAERGDQDALLALDEVGQVLALGIATTVAILDPSLVVLGGGVGSQPALVRSGTEQTRRLVGRPPSIRASRLGDLGPIFGAIALALSVASGTVRR